VFEKLAKILNVRYNKITDLWLKSASNKTKIIQNPDGSLLQVSVSVPEYINPDFIPVTTPTPPVTPPKAFIPVTTPTPPKAAAPIPVTTPEQSPIRQLISINENFLNTLPRPAAEAWNMITIKALRGQNKSALAILCLKWFKEGSKDDLKAILNEIGNNDSSVFMALDAANTSPIKLKNDDILKQITDFKNKFAPNDDTPAAFIPVTTPTPPVTPPKAFIPEALVKSIKQVDEYDKNPQRSPGFYSILIDTAPEYRHRLVNYILSSKSRPEHLKGYLERSLINAAKLDTLKQKNDDFKNKFAPNDDDTTAAFIPVTTPTPPVTKVVRELYVHKFNPEITIELIEPTTKGYKVYQFERGKKKVAFFNKEDINGSKSIFKKIPVDVPVTTPTPPAAFIPVTTPTPPAAFIPVTTPTPPAPAQKTKSSGASAAKPVLHNSSHVHDVKLSDILTNHEYFQNRKDKKNKESADKIIKAVADNTFFWETLDPILLYLAPENIPGLIPNRLYILSGHGRNTAFNQLAENNVKVQGRGFDRIPAKIIENITLAEAKKIARNSNTLGRKESDTERASYYRDLRLENVSKKDIKEEATTTEGKNNTLIINLSYLKPHGLTLDAYKLFEHNPATSTDIKKIASWIGELRQYFPQISDLHEDEIFRFLKDNLNLFKNFVELKAKVEKVVMAFDFNPTSALNLQKKIYKNAFEQSYDNERAELVKSIERLQGDQERLNESYVTKSAMTDDTQKRSELNKIYEEKLDTINKQLIVARKKLLDFETSNRPNMRPAELFGIKKRNSLIIF
jgi:hypothetical protein